MVKLVNRTHSKTSNMKIKLILVLPVLIFCLPLSAQRFYNLSNNSEAWFGGGLVVSQSSISGVYDMLVDEAIFLPTPHDNRIVNNIGGAFWVRYGVLDSDFFIEGQFSVQSVLKTGEPIDGGHFYLKNDKGLEYSILFDYDQVNFSMFPGWFIPINTDSSPLGVYITSGITWSILSGTSIDYVSNEPQFDLAIEASLEEAFKYRNDLLLQVGGGIQLKPDIPGEDDIVIELRYTQGWGQIDIMETQNNRFFWREKENKTRMHHQLALTVLFWFNQ
jgi:hypothetical protein